MSGTNDNNKRDDAATEPSDHQSGKERRQTRPTIARRAEVSRAIGRLRLDDFHKTLSGVAVAVFGEQATVVAHLRTSSGREWVTFVVDAADPASVVKYEEFLPRERAFWTAYSQIVKPVAQFMVAVRPARGWCRVEALAPLFSMMKPPDIVT